MLVGITKAQEAASVLELKLLGADEADVKRAYRTAAKTCHPDHHGKEKLQQWSRVSWAYEVLKHWLRQNPPEDNRLDEQLAAGDCRACGGTGRVDVRKTNFGTALKMQCVMCRGLGTLIPEENDSD